MRRLVLVPVVVACVLGLGGCRGGDRAALPATPGTAVPSATVPVSARPGTARSGPVATGDPLAGIESEVDAVERDLDSDAGADAGPAPRR